LVTPPDPSTTNSQTPLGVASSPSYHCILPNRWLDALPSEMLGLANFERDSPRHLFTPQVLRMIEPWHYDWCHVCALEGGSGAWTQGLVLARLSLYHLNHIPSSLAFSVFWD
jgi:hypothetical protein